jgi:predicted MPP superfamily phosphohydrolase
MMEKVIDETNRAKADFIFLTGDYVQRDWKSIHTFTKFTRKLESKHGIYAVLGNHDYFEGASSEIMSVLTENGIKVLNNESYFPFGTSQGFEIVGVGDFHHDFHPERIPIQERIPRIILSHNPDSANQLSKLPGINMIQLSGHSHGGQICLPNPFQEAKNGNKGGIPLLAVFQTIVHYLPFLSSVLPSSLQKVMQVVENWDVGRAGLHNLLMESEGEIKQFYVHTSGGLATHPPMRLFCIPEMSIFTVVGSSHGLS